MTLSGGGKSKKTSWIDFVKKVQNDEGISFKEAMSKASQLKKQGKMKGGDSDGAMDVVVDEDEVMETSPTSAPMDDVNMMMDVEEDSDSSSPMAQEGGKRKSKRRTAKRSKRKGKGKSNKKSKKRTKRSKSRRRKQKK